MEGAIEIKQKRVRRTKAELEQLAMSSEDRAKEYKKVYYQKIRTSTKEKIEMTPEEKMLDKVRKQKEYYLKTRKSNKEMSDTTQWNKKSREEMTAEEKIEAGKEYQRIYRKNNLEKLKKYQVEYRNRDVITI